MQRYEHGGDIYGDNAPSLDFSVNVNPLGMPPCAKNAVLSAVDSFSLYPDCECRQLCAALSIKHGVDDDSILCGNGASDLIFRLCAALKPQTVLTLAPTFSEYERSARIFGARIREHRLCEENDFMLTEALLHALTPDVDMVFLCSPNNPTGRLADKDLLCAVAERCARIGAIMVLDECFMGFTHGESMADRLSDYPNLLILNAFTKLYGMAGLRLGYVLGNSELIKSIKPYGAEWSVSTAAQAAGMGALSEAGWAEKTLKLIATERRFMTDALTELGLRVYKSDANFLLVKSQVPLYEKLRSKRILVRACDNFTGLDSHFIRLGLKTHEENVALISALKELGL